MPLMPVFSSRHASHAKIFAHIMPTPYNAAHAPHAAHVIPLMPKFMLAQVMSLMLAHVWRSCQVPKFVVAHAKAHVSSCHAN